MIINCSKIVKPSIGIKSRLNNQSTFSTIRVHFQEYKNIGWDAEVGEKGGKYYLKLILVDEERKIFSLDDNISYVYVGPNFDALMESLFNS